MSDAGIALYNKNTHFIFCKQVDIRAVLRKQPFNDMNGAWVPSGNVKRGTSFLSVLGNMRSGQSVF